MLVAINGESGEALRAEGFGQGVAVAFGLTIVGKLEIRVACDRRTAGVANLQADIDDIAVAPEGEELVDLQGVFALCREPQLDGVGAVSQRTCTRSCLP